MITFQIDASEGSFNGYLAKKEKEAQTCKLRTQIDNEVKEF